MRIDYEHLLEHPRERVWKALVDPEILARILPGVETLEAVAPGKYDAVIQLGTPALKGRFRGWIEIADQQFPARYALRGQGKGATGWVRGSAQIDFDEHAGGTRVRSAIEVQLGGRMASIGQRMLEGVAKALIREFFESLDRELAGRRQTGSRMLLLTRLIGRWFRALLGGNRGAKPES